MDQQNNAQVPNPPVVPPVVPPVQPAQQQPQPPQPVQPQPPVVNPVVPPAGQVPIVQAQVHQNPNGNIDLKLQQTKLPEFFWSEGEGLHLGIRICQKGGQDGLRQQLD